tara:strand:+ start:312 stop:698 length:387 start_codon:yes stop_codon:yes gene_type:complete
MNKIINNFIEKVVKNESNTLAIDFDGVIHDHNLGFHDGTIYGNPIPGAIEAIKKLSKKYKIVIFTCKANPKRPLINGKTGSELIWEWLKKHDLESCVKDVTYDKINALYYIDDKAISFNSWDNTLKHL